MKKLPFKPTALREAGPTAPSSGPDELDLFRRSKEMEPIMAAEQQRRMQKRLRHQEEERRRQPVSSSPSASPPPPLDQEEDPFRSPSPPTRASTHAPREPNRHTPTDGPDGCSHPPAKRARTEGAPSSSSPARKGPVTRSSTITPTGTVAAGPPLTVNLDSDSDSDEVVALSPPPPLPPEGEKMAEAEEEDEFGEYVRLAEEQRARQQLLLGDDALSDRSSSGRDKVEILVTSAAPGAKPCYMKVLYDKPLRIVRDCWIARQREKGLRLAPDQEQGWVLTWRRQKVYSSSTLLHLGMRPQGDGRILVDGRPDAHGLTDGRTRVHLEAWTPDLFRQMERQEEQRRRAAPARPGHETDTSIAPADDHDGGRDSQEPAEPTAKLRIILKSRHLDDVKLTVRPETTVETVITGFRSQRQLGPQHQLALFFDGDRLDEHLTMADAGIVDLDTLDLHLKPLDSP